MVSKRIKSIRNIFTVILLFNFIFLFSCFSCSNNDKENEDDTEMAKMEITEDITVFQPELPVKPSDYIKMPQSLNVVYKIVPYDNGTGTTELKMDIFYPTSDKYDKSPVVVGFHGGGWLAGDKSQITYIFSPVISKLRENGYTVATVQYRYATDTVYFPAQAEDCADAILFLKNNCEKYNIDTDSIGVLGYSAGAHLAMISSYAMGYFSSAEETADIKYCVSCAGPTKMYGEEPDKYPRNTLYLLENLFHGTYPEKEETYKKGSPYFYIAGESDEIKKVPLLLVHDEKDDVVPFEQSQVMFDKASEAGIPCELLVLHGVRHNIDFGMDYMISPSSSEAVDVILNFIYKYSGK